jgi:hypothetical protein
VDDPEQEAATDARSTADNADAPEAKKPKKGKSVENARNAAYRKVTNQLNDLTAKIQASLTEALCSPSVVLYFRVLLFRVQKRYTVTQ